MTLHHDFVVRDYEPVRGLGGAQRRRRRRCSFKPATPADAAHPRSVNLVVVDAATGRPVQAVKIGC